MFSWNSIYITMKGYEYLRKVTNEISYQLEVLLAAICDNNKEQIETNYNIINGGSGSLQFAYVSFYFF